MDISYPQHMNIITLHNITQVVAHFFLIGQILLKTETLARRKEAVKKKTKMPHIHVTSIPKTHKTAQTKDQKMAPTTLRKTQHPKGAPKEHLKAAGIVKKNTPKQVM